jgi:hypothetical protein
MLGQEDYVSRVDLVCGLDREMRNRYRFFVSKNLIPGVEIHASLEWLVGTILRFYSKKLLPLKY